MNSATNVTTVLLRNGNIIERARLSGRSLTSIERAIITAGRNVASENNLTIRMMNAIEMEGEREREFVLAPVRIDSEFSYYDAPFEDIPANPSYLVHRSNHPSLCAGSHVSADQLRECGQKVPKTPTYEKWVVGGKKVVRAVRS